MKRIAIVTATRAEYGILTPLIRRINEDADLELDLIVTGTHLFDSYGNTQSHIENDGFDITHRIPILADGNTPYDISVTMANAIKGFAKNFKYDRPDIVVVLGDRTEMLGVAAAAMNENIPIAHIHGGEVTEGAVDDCVRHALTKMSYLHFTATERYRKRVVQLGESPERVFNVGALSTENILKTPLLNEEEMKKSVNIPLNAPYAVVTFHPVTLEREAVRQQINELCRVMEKFRNYFFLITMANSDAGGNEINRILSNFADKHDNAVLVASLGMVRYLSAVKYSAFLLGNSSSGILEAPVLGTPAINIGDRQKGRIMTDTVICCEPDYEDICRSVSIAEHMEHNPDYIYGNGDTSKEIVRIIKVFLMNDRINLKKTFFDLID